MTWINFQEVKKQASFEAVLNHFDLTGKQTGDEIRICCPFHDDKNPSCGVNIADNKFNCFSCNEHGNVLDFATLMIDGNPQDSNDLRAGAKLVMDVCQIETPRSPQRRSKATKSKVRPEPKKAVKKAHKSKISAGEDVINPPLKFQLNLSNETEFFERNDISQEQVDFFGLGLAQKGTMAGRIAIPIHNENNELVAYAGRWADEELPEDEEKYKFPKGFKKTHVLYGLNHLPSEFRHVVLVEGFWSVQRMRRLGIKTVACMGTSIDPEQIALLSRFGVRFVTVMFDGDEAGYTGAKKVCVDLAQHFYTRVIDLEDGHKPDIMSDNFLSSLKS